jgi:iron complex transport system substrate-binding protein
MRLRALAVAMLLASCARAPVSPVSHREQPTLVSLNPCSDAVLTEVADPRQLLAISSWSQDPASSSMDLNKACRFRAVGNSLEEVLALRPDAVVADAFLPAPTRAALERLHIAVVQLPIAQSVEQSRAQVMQLARLAGHPDRGKRLLARIDAALARAAPPPGARPVSAVVWQSGGIVPGPDSLIGDLLRRTGFRNLAAEHGMKQADFLPLETMLADPPQVILAAGNAASQEDRLLSHPALAALKGTRRVSLDSALLWCGGPSMVRTAERLAEVRQSIPLPFARGVGGGPVR